jgi:hypothetical protein
LTEAEKPVNLKDLIVKVKEIHKGLEKTSASLKERIRLIETDRAGLLVEIENLKRAAESRAGALEIEIGQLRQDIKSLKEILSAAE